MSGIDRQGLRAGSFSLLASDDLERVHIVALEVLAQTGVVILHQPTLTLLKSAGCRVIAEEQRVCLPPDLIEEAVARAPGVVDLYDRSGKPAMKLGAGPLHARTSSGATSILDPASGACRPATRHDAALAARLADALPHVHGVSTMAVQPADVPVSMVDLHALHIALTNSSKPLGYVCLNEGLLDAVVAMAATVAGGDASLRERPFLTALAESTSPLRFVSSQMAVLQAFGSRGLPLTLHAHPIAGLTAPVTLCGLLVITHAEVLALATIAQLLRAGTPVIYGMSSSVPDMHTGTNLSGAVEIGLLGAAVAQLARRCGLPCVVSTGTDAHAPGDQSVMERLMTLLLPALAGVDLVNLTTLSTKMSFSLEQVVLDETVLSLVERCLQGIAVDEATLALDLIQTIGPGGAYLTTSHTLDYFREELLVPDLVSRGSRVAWEAAGAPDMRARARERVHDILDTHQPASLPDGVTARLDEIVREAQTSATK
ncbi:MAG: trimethylamine methyltransferase family protein [Anaerolineae bacterium]|jgi:trimethylamine--corrinoid protein Co-methyltransferase